MRIFTLLFFLFCFTAVEAQRKRGERYDENKLPNPDTAFRAMKSGIQLCVIDYASAWQMHVSRLESERPRALHWSSLVPKPLPNIYFFRDRNGTPLKAYNTTYSLQRLSEIFAKYPTTTTGRFNGGLVDWSNPRAIYLRVPMPNTYLGRNGITGHFIVQSKVTTDYNDKSVLYGLIDTVGNLKFPMAYEFIEEIFGRFLVKRNGRIGVLTANSDTVVPLTYTAVEFSGDDIMLFSLNKKYKAIYQVDTRELTSIGDYDWVDNDRLNTVDADKHFPLVLVRKNGKYGFINRKYFPVVPPVYDRADGFFKDGLSRVLRNNRWGFVNGKGVEVIPCKYEDAERFDNAVASVMEDGVQLCIDTKGKEASGCQHQYSKWEHRRELDEGKTYIEGRRIIERSHTYGLTDMDNRIIVPLIYNSITPFDGSGNGKHRFDQRFYKVRHDRQWGVIDINGNIIIPVEYDEISGFTGDGRFVMIKNDERYGLLAPNFEWIVPCRYESLNPYSIPGRIIFRENKLQGWMDMKLNVVVQPQFDEVSWMRNGRIPVSKNKKHGFVDISGEIIIPLSYESAGSQFYNGMLVVQQNKKWGIIDSLNQVVVPIIYDDVRNFEKQITAVKKGKYFGFIDRAGNAVTDFIYEFVGWAWEHDGLVKVVRGEKIGYLNETGDLAIPCIYDEEAGYHPAKGHYLKLNGTWSYVK